MTPIGPAGVTFTPAELTIILTDLNRIPTTENGDIRRKIERYMAEYHPEYIRFFNEYGR